MTWHEYQHPRNPDNGEFVEHGGGWLGGVADQIAGHRYVQGRDIRGELDYDRVWGEGHSFSEGPDWPMQRIWTQQGFDWEPRVVTVDEMDAAVAAGWTEMYRRVGKTDTEGARYAEQYRTGSAYAGLGGHANGTYAMPGWRRSDAHGYGVTELRMALRPDARVIHIGELYDLMQAEGLSPFGGFGDMPTRDAALSDAGRFASALGYDAIEIHALKNDQTYHDSIDEWVILNRTATMVQEAG